MSLNSVFATAFPIFSWTINELRIIHDAICTGQNLSIVNRRMGGFLQAR